MIKEIFLPEKIGSKRIYAQWILGLTIQEKFVTCVKVHAKRSKTIIEKLLTQEIEESSGENYTQQAAYAIKKIIDQAGKYDQIRVSIPASLVIFKELEVPFKDPDKIRMILDYEIESMLPFSIDEAVIDFIITKQFKKDEKKSQILVAAVRNEDLQSVLDIYHTAGIEPTAITIDLFSVYGLYQQIPEYQNLKNASAVVDFGSHSTRVVFLIDGQLKLTRIIPRGISTVAKSISDDLNVPPAQIEQRFEKYGLQTTTDQTYDKSLQKHLINFFNDIQFTLNSFSLKLNYYQGISKILFTGIHSQSKGLVRFCNDLLQIPCEVFSCEKLFSDKQHFKNKIKKLTTNWTPYTVALGTALTSPEQVKFDLRKKTFALSQVSIINKQLITASIIVIVMLSIISIRGYLQTSSLSKDITNIEVRETAKLKKIFPADYKFPRQTNIRNLTQKAESLVAEKLELWAPFGKERLRPLEIIQELTNIIDKRRFDVSVSEISITEDDGSTKIIVDGFFRSKTGSDHFKYFDELEKRFSESKLLILTGVIDSKGEDGTGVRFTAKLRLKED